jgi:hypothetical protein
MAREKVFRTICDRCSGVFEEKNSPSKDTDDSVGAPKVYIEVDGALSVKYEDLCAKCEDRVKNLIGDLKPLGKEKKTRKSKDKKAKKPAEKKDSKKEPSTPEGEKPAS